MEMLIIFTSFKEKSELQIVWSEFHGSDMREKNYHIGGGKFGCVINHNYHFLKERWTRINHGKH